MLQNLSVPSGGSTIEGGLFIITIKISCIWDQTSVNHQLYYIHNYHDISMKPRMKYHTEEILTPVTITIPILQLTSHPLQP
jgi:hypothetical protein